jgi:hypothetical protein
MWKNYGNGHTIFDASASTSPAGGGVNNTNSDVVWSSTYPTLMGWNGTNTYGVRVDSARRSDSAASADSANYANSAGSAGTASYADSAGTAPASTAVESGDRFAVGAYAFLRFSGNFDVTFPSTVNGDTLTKASGDESPDANNTGVLGYGTWRCMGFANGGSGSGDGKRNTLWQRVS